MKFKYIKAAVMLLALAVSGSGWAQNMKDVGNSIVAKYEQQDYAGALAELQPLANQGDMWAQSVLALHYIVYEDKPDFAQAAIWFGKAAEQGDASSQYMLGNLYEAGEGVEQDYSQAFKWYMKAAEQEYVKAFNELGRMYEYGLGVEQSAEGAFKFYSEAVMRGNEDAKKGLDRILGAMGFSIPNEETTK